MKINKRALLALAIFLSMNGLSFSKINEYAGMCDASASLSVDDEHFIIANDEDNILRIYHVNKKEPVATYDLSAFFKIEYDDKSPESDIEGATKLGDVYFFITSHGRDKNGRLRRNRHQFFAVQVNPQTRQITPVGKSYVNLMDDLVQLEELKKLNIYDSYLPRDAKNEKMAPKERGVNIEGLAATPDNKSVLIGFRNPLPDGKAIIVELLNPLEIVTQTHPPRFGKTLTLDITGRGVRSLEFLPQLKNYLVVGGAHDEVLKSKLYMWNGESTDLTEIKSLNFSLMEGFNPEAISIYANRKTIQIYSDDGTIMHPDGQGGECECKDLSNPLLKTYRGLWLDMDALNTQ